MKESVIKKILACIPEKGETIKELSRWSGYSIPTVRLYVEYLKGERKIEMRRIGNSLLVTKIGKK